MAAQAGLRAGDVITAIDGRDVPASSTAVARVVRAIVYVSFTTAWIPALCICSTHACRAGVEQRTWHGHISATRTVLVSQRGIVAQQARDLAGASLSAQQWHHE